MKPSDTIFEGLDAIDWGSLSHAYGSASDVPHLLRRLLGVTSPRQGEAGPMDKFANQIFHQGTLYEATPYVVPFLIRIVETSTARNRADVLWMLADMGRLSMDLPDPNSPEHTPYHEYARLTRAEVLKGYDAYVKILSDAKPKIRKGAAEILANLPERIADSEPVLRQQIDAETDLKIKPGLVSSLGKLWCRSHSDHSRLVFNKALTVDDQAFMLSFMRNTAESPDVRFAAALEVGRLFGETFLDEVIPVLIESLSFIKGSEADKANKIQGQDQNIQTEANRINDRKAIGNPDSSWRTLNMAYIHTHIALGYEPKVALAWYLASSLAEDVDLRIEAAARMKDLANTWRWIPPLIAPRLFEMLTDPDELVRYKAAESFRALGFSAEPTLTLAEQSEAPFVRELAATIRSEGLTRLHLIQSGTRFDLNAWPLDRLLEELKKRFRPGFMEMSQSNRIGSIIDKLVQHGDQAKAAIPELRELLRTQNDIVRSAPMCQAQHNHVVQCA